MDPGRRAMIEGRLPSITSPRRDPKTRVSKPVSKPAASSANKYLTQDELSQQFVADEDKFVLKQAKKKADIRVREGRAKPIDYLAFNLRFVDPDRDILEDEDADVEIDLPSPEAVIEGLNEAQLDELSEELTSYHTLETNGRNREYWTALKALCADRHERLRPSGPEGRAVNFVAADIDKILAPKSYEQLQTMQEQVQAKLQSSEPIDTDYWEGVLKRLLIWKARTQLKNVCKAITERRIELLRLRDPDKAKALSTSDKQSSPSSTAATQPSGDTGSLATTRSSAITPARKAAGSAASAATGEPAVPPTAPPPGTERFALPANEDFSQATKALYEREVARGLGDNEEIFTAEETVPSNTGKPQWADKYRPRKPRYFNRVQMGYEWNKYNQTHYDHDHPPPKVVQGYRFNIFYPDLIDKTKTPTFKIIREHGRRRGESFAPAGEEDTCLIRFVAGPPYEDIAFRIVDREWDYSAKRERGFKSSFDKGILQLHFQFKKIYYRK